MKKNTVIDRIIDSGLIEPGLVVIVGLSGGPDSLCLLHALYSISDSFDLKLVPVHINHKLRPEADDEAEHVTDICDRMDLDCEMYEVDCSGLAETLGISTEEAGRQLRYDIFDDVASNLVDMGCDRDRIIIALAHNADDQSETVLFRLLRGTGPHGLSGIPSVRLSEDGFIIVRPLLSVDRSDIEQYIKENRLKPNIDKSNDENTYTRNKIRNELIPYLEENFNPNIKEALRRFAVLAHMDDSLINEIAFSVLDENMKIDEESGDVIIAVDELQDAPPAILSRVVQIILKIIGLEAVSGYKLVTSIMNIICGENPSASVDLPADFVAVREYDKIIFTCREEKELTQISGVEISPQILMIKDFHPDEDVPYAAFDFDSFNEAHPGRAGDLKLRTRKEGDYLPIRNGSKKIQDLFVDEKVNKRARDGMQMVAIDSEILWILPSEHFSREQERNKGKYSPKYHISDTTERVLFIELTDLL